MLGQENTSTAMFQIAMFSFWPRLKQVFIYGGLRGGVLLDDMLVQEDTSTPSELAASAAAIGAQAANQNMSPPSSPSTPTVQAPPANAAAKVRKWAFASFHCVSVWRQILFLPLNFYPLLFFGMIIGCPDPRGFLG
jgi:hypothetical protein